MSAYVVFTKERQRDEAAMKQYWASAPQTMGGHSGKPLVLYGEVETLEGPAVEGAVIFEFPSMEEARAWYHSDAYTEARKNRHLGADYRVFIAAGV